MLAQTRRTLSQSRMFHKAHYSPYASVLKQPEFEGLKREEIVVINPANGAELSRVSSASPEDVEAVINASQKAFESGIWSKAPVLVRSKVLSRLARILESRIPELAKLESLQTGRTIREMNAQLGRLPEWIDYYAALLRTYQDIIVPTQGKLLNYVQRVPLGVVAQITPFNHPMLIAIKKIAPALAAGNSVIVKPSELAPLTVLEFAEMATEAGIPPNVLSVLPGYGSTTGKTIITNPLIRKVDVTAGTETGRALGAIAGPNLAHFTAELGGKAPIVIFDDADMASAVNGAAFACFIASGQTCISGTRLIIQSSIYDDFMAKFLEKVSSIKQRMGDPLNPKSTMGTIISMGHLQRIKATLSRTKGKIIVGGGQMLGQSELDGFDFSRGSFFAPTVISDVQVEDELWQEEIFGPVVVVKQFSDEAEGIYLANACKYGLGAGIWTSDLSRAHRVAAEIQAGLCWVNTHHRNDPSSPWGGMKDSGVGRENGVEGLESYSQTKSTIVNIASQAESRETDDWFAESSNERRYG